MRRHSKSQGDSKNATRSKLTTRRIFSTAGSFGWPIRWGYRHDWASCKAIFCLKGYLYFLRLFARKIPFKTRLRSGQVRPRQGTESCNFGAPSPLEPLHWIFLRFFSSIYVQFSKTSPTKSGESSEKSSGEDHVKSCHVCSFFMVFSALNFYHSGPKVPL